MWATAASGAIDYRTGTATTATVEKTLTVPGTAGPVDQATADFQVPGTVAAVDVTAGQSVTAGQTLASLDTATLQQAVTSAEINVSAAVAKLTEDEAAEAASTTTTTTTTAPTTTTTTAPAKGNSTLSQAQQAVVNAQQTADTAAQQAGAALAQAQTACGSAPTSGTTTTTKTPPTKTKPGTSTAAEASTGSAPSGTSSTGTTATCAAALKAALAAQDQVSTDQKAVAAAESSLAQLLMASGSGSPATSGTVQPSGSGGTGTSGTHQPTASSTTTTTQPASGTSSSGATSNGSNSPGSGTVRATAAAAQLASDQAAIDTATASLIEARQSLASAQLTTPIAGTVVSVALATGQTVSAGSTTDAVTIISAGSFEVTTSVTSSQVAELKVGDPAEVTVNGTTGALNGTVARVGPADTSGSSITYPVVVALPAGSHGIRTGSAANAVIVVRRAVKVLVVPTSAVHTAGTGNSYVTVVRTGQAERRPVTVGIVGSIVHADQQGHRQGCLRRPRRPVGTAPVCIHKRDNKRAPRGRRAAGGDPPLDLTCPVGSPRGGRRKCSTTCSVR